MSGKIVVLLMLVLIVILVLFLMQDSEVAKKLKASVKKDKMNKVLGASKKKEVEITEGTVVYECVGEHKYKPHKVTTRVYTIGSDPSSNLVLNDNKVEPKHAVIVKRLRGDRVFFEFINLAKINPTEYIDGKGNAYYMGYKQGLELDEKEAFFVGTTKLVVTTSKLSDIHRGDTGAHTQFANVEGEKPEVEAVDMEEYRSEPFIVRNSEPSRHIVDRNEFDV